MRDVEVGVQVGASVLVNAIEAISSQLGHRQHFGCALRVASSYGRASSALILCFNSTDVGQ